MTEDPVEAAEWLRTYRHPMTELISIGPWASYSAFNQGAGVDLPRLLLSDRVRSACAEEVAGLDYAAQQAKYLFSYEDAAEWIEANVETRVMSVVVPLSIFATDPDALRTEFEEEKRLRFTNVKTKAPPHSRPLERREEPREGGPRGDRQLVLGLCGREGSSAGGLARAALDGG